MITEALESGTGTVYSVAVYLAAETAGGLAVTFVLKERQNVPLNEAAAAAAAAEKDEPAAVTA
ncbi:hypothetical protein ACFWWC_48025 [Streptomyces sp. NPDC058642]|uniref:hypothetical protein n=1 Tax=Streptomyces sp. NPDC058642 TaxID=3346572 RepID=UPI0036594CFB